MQPHHNLDTQGYTDGYAIAFSNIQYLRKKYNLPIYDNDFFDGKICFAYIRVYYTHITDELCLGETYAAMLDDRWEHYKEVMRLLDEYPVLDEELLSDTEHRMVNHALPSIMENVAEEGGYRWLREWYIQKFYSLESIDDPEFGVMYPAELEMARAMSGDTRRLLLDSIEYSQRGYARPVSGYIWDMFIHAFRADLFAKANAVRRERINGWKKNWNTLPGIGG